ncbi:unannotated protein [freshwater metagenome]|uniref:Unannotated protein n=1 Tax=freshwater metagenome TaxID=449393 RepID=A0A6J7QEU0_9ZZZZ
MRKVSVRLSINARAVTISETNNPAPCSRQSVRKGAFVIPAIGARTTGGSIMWSPLASGRVSPFMSLEGVALAMPQPDLVQCVLDPLCRDRELLLPDLREYRNQ